MDRFDLIGAILGSSLITWVLGRILGKRKEEIELALNYQTFYKDLIEDLEGKIDRLSNKIEMLVERDRENQATIEAQKKNLDRWELTCSRQERSIVELKLEINRLFTEIEEHENGNGSGKHL